MNLRGVDLNLLVILDALLQEAHVSRAAARAGLSQPAMSSALERCRQLFGDPLLERDGRGMRRTVRAEALREPLHAALAAIGAILDRPAPDLAGIRQTVRVAMADVLQPALVPELLPILQTAAPGIDLVFLPWMEPEAAYSAAIRGAADLVVSLPPRADRQRLGIAAQVRIANVVVMRAAHPAAAACTLDAWLAYPHLLVSSRGLRQTPLDDQLEAIARTRRVGMVVPSFLLAPAMLRASDMIALLPSLAVAGAGDADLHRCPPPVPVDNLELCVAWARRSEDDAAVRFVGDSIAALLRRFVDGAND